MSTVLRAYREDPFGRPANFLGYEERPRVCPLRPFREFSIPDDLFIGVKCSAWKLLGGETRRKPRRSKIGGELRPEQIQPSVPQLIPHRAETHTRLILSREQYKSYTLLHISRGIFRSAGCEHRGSRAWRCPWAGARPRNPELTKGRKATKRCRHRQMSSYYR